MKQIYMICPIDSGSVLTFADGSTMDVDTEFLDKFYPEPGGYYGDGVYESRSRHEARHDPVSGT